MRGLLLDLDGVVYVGDQPVPGAAGVVDWLRREGVPYRYLTNTTSRPRRAIDVHDVLQEGDKVVARVSFIGTHTGEFMGVPASGNRVDIKAIDIVQFRGDLCVAHWGVMDMAGALAQMGAGPHA